VGVGLGHVQVQILESAVSKSLAKQVGEFQYHDQYVCGE